MELEKMNRNISDKVEKINDTIQKQIESETLNKNAKQLLKNELIEHITQYYEDNKRRVY